MRRSDVSTLKLILVLMLLVGVVCSCCSCVVQINAAVDTKEDTSEKALKSADDTGVYGDYNDYDAWVDSRLSDNIITRAEWLELLFDAVDIEIRDDLWYKYFDFQDIDSSANNDVLMTAVDLGIVSGSNKVFGAEVVATRQYVATSLVNALGYDMSHNLDCTDADEVKDKNQVATAVYLGFLQLDDHGCFNTYHEITPGEVRFILAQLKIKNDLEGKYIVSFGDSIMHGDGNYRVGIAQLIADRYMMSYTDYSIGGATFAHVEGKDQISNQILSAIQNREQPDIILINGGTNDMRRASAGQISDDFEYGVCGRETFASGMEYAFWLLKTHFPTVPVVYVRAHDMVCVYETNELHYGSMAVSICDRWDICVADVFSDTGFDCHDDDIRYLYTAHINGYYWGDSIHPNRQGYYKYYLPLIVEKMQSVL